MLPLILLSALTTSYAAPVAEPIAMPVDLAKRASGTNYNQNYIAGGANVQYSPNQSAGSYSVTWNTNADFVVGLGWTTGDATPITYSGSFKVNSGTPGGLLSVYGWTTNPLVEYYVVENQGNGYSTGGSQKGTLTSDGSTYQVWQHQQTNQPSIQGTSTFQQYISIRQTPRSSGTVTLQNHFDAWKSFGMTLGTFNFQVMAVESWSGGGSAQISLSKGAASGGSSSSAAPTSAAPTKTAAPTSAAPTSAAPSASATGSTGGSGATSPKYGQCGGQGWNGPTTCASGSTCKVSNQWYSQCL